MLSSPTSSSLVVARSLFPYVDKVFHPKVLKFLGRAMPWPKLNHLMDMAGTLHSKSRGIHETKKRLLELGDDATVRQVGDGKDITSILSAHNASRLYIRNLMRSFIVKANTMGPEDDRLSDEELVSQMTYVPSHVYWAASMTKSFPSGYFSYRQLIQHRLLFPGFYIYFPSILTSRISSGRS